MSTATHAEFDFWLGEWDLTWGEDGRATNVIQRMLDGKVIQEQFTALAGTPLNGMSWTVYSEGRGCWLQTWVDNQGSYLDFTGGMQGDRMILSRAMTHNGQTILQRMVWYNIGANEFDWNWEASKNGGETWDLQWQIHYTRRQ